jgi:hypothetical protein
MAATYIACDPNGGALDNVTAFALDKTRVQRRNRSCSASFKIANKNADPNAIKPGNWLKVFRNGILRFGGEMRVFEQSWDYNVGYTTVTAFDVFSSLFSRFVLTLNGQWRPPATPKFTSMTVEQIIFTMVDRSLNFHGGFPSTLGTGSMTATTVITAGPYYQAKIGQAVLDFCDTGLVDVWFQPLDNTNSLLSQMHLYGQQGGTSPAVFEYGVGTKNVKLGGQLIDVASLANDVSFFGANRRKRSLKTNGASIAQWGRRMDAKFVNQIDQQKFLDDLAETELGVRLQPKEIVSFVPVPERAPQPYDSYFLGDYVTLVAGGTHVLNPFTGLVRVHGFTEIDRDDGVEEVTDLQLSFNG